MTEGSEKQEGLEKKRWVLIDGNTILHRAYPAIIFALQKPTGLRLGLSSNGRWI